MTESFGQLRSILYQNEFKTVTILDGPTSIVKAQGFLGGVQNLLLSCDPQTKPHISCDPKTAKGKEALLADQKRDAEYHKHVVGLVTKALEVLSQVYHGEWHLPRQTQHEGGVRKEPEFEFDNSSVLYGTRISNDSNELFRLATPENGQDMKIAMPPHSSFILGDVQEICQFNLHLNLGSLKQPSYELILMDPPWPNASAKRRSAYKRSANLKDIKHMLLDIPVPEMLNKLGLIGIWITNKASFRTLVLGEDGLFEQWGVQLYEEWIWVKTTRNGEPIVALESLWRKPYEIFLLGRRSVPPGEEPKARVILGVPDIHSRKPCLKSLIEPLLTDASHYRGLEIFARYLVSGWESWGDQVFKFNWEGYWYIPDSKAAIESPKSPSNTTDEPIFKKQRL